MIEATEELRRLNEKVTKTMLGMQRRFDINESSDPK